MKKITTIYPSKLGKALCQSFHQSIADILKDSGIDQEREFKAISARYQQQLKEMQGLVAYSYALETTPAIQDAMKIISTRYRFLFRIFKSFSLDRRVVTAEEYAKLKHEVIDVFPLSILRQGWAERLGKLDVLVAHLKSDWMPLMEKAGLEEAFQQLEEQVAQLQNAILTRSDEKTGIEKGHAARIKTELFETYALVCLYIEAWSNTDSEESDLQLRQQRASEALAKINEHIASTNFSLAIARSNRRRAKKVTSSADNL